MTDNPNDEPQFTLLARDPSAYFLVRIWAAIHEGDVANAAANFQYMLREVPMHVHYNDETTAAYALSARMLAWRQQQAEKRLMARRHQTRVGLGET